MMMHGTKYILIIYAYSLSSRGDDTALSPDGLPILRCDGGFCDFNTTDTNLELPADFLEKKIGPNVVIVNGEKFPKCCTPTAVGAIGVDNADQVARVHSAFLSKTAILDVHIYSQGEAPSTWYTQNLLDSQDGTVIGLVNVPRPIDNPDTRFASLAQDPILAGMPTGLRSAIDPAALIPSPTDGCTTNKCFMVIPSVDVFYMGPDPTNTACLSAITSPPPSPMLPQLTMDPSYVYLVYPPPQAFDGCRKWKWGDEFTVTTSFKPWELSTLEYRPDAPPATKTMDFADLPCPPTHIAKVFDPTVPYYPILVPPLYYRWGYDNGSDKVEGSCALAGVRDPPVFARRVGAISGPKDGGDTIA
ncbi:MAG: hypothetical protein Q9178_007233 [Gyalolechia marmorata]